MEKIILHTFRQNIKYHASYFDIEKNLELEDSVLASIDHVDICGTIFSLKHAEN